MIKEVYYGVGNADESDRFYYPDAVFEQYSTEAAARKAIKQRLKEWGRAEGWTEEDYDICKITITVERFPFKSTK